MKKLTLINTNNKATIAIKGENDIKVVIQKYAEKWGCAPEQISTRVENTTTAPRPTAEKIALTKRFEDIVFETISTEENSVLQKCKARLATFETQERKAKEELLEAISLLKTPACWRALPDVAERIAKAEKEFPALKEKAKGARAKAVKARKAYKSLEEALRLKASDFVRDNGKSWTSEEDAYLQSILAI